MKRQNFIKRLKEEEKWAAASDAIDYTLESGIRSISWKLMKRLTLLPFQGKEVEGDIPDLRNEIDERLRLEGWKKIFKTLTERERLIVEGIYFNGLSASAAGRKAGLACAMSNALHNRALRKLRHANRIDLMRKFDIPIHEEWYQKKEITNTVKENSTIQEEKEWIPPKPFWVKVDFAEDGVPYLAADVKYIWYVKPVTRKVYNAWLSKAMEEHEAIHRP